jgi:signal peptidase I
MMLPPDEKPQPNSTEEAGALSDLALRRDPARALNAGPAAPSTGETAACPGLETAPPAPAGSGRLAGLIRDILLSVGVSAFIIIFLYQPVRVEGTSMLPVLEDQERLFVNKLAFHVGEIHRGDVVVFRYPRDQTTSYIKRVVGLPGDQVRIDHGQVFINGKRLPEPYVPARFADDQSQPQMRIPDNMYFVMGDHRCISFDSRAFGPVPRSLIYGKAAFVYWPVEQAGVVR